MADMTLNFRPPPALDIVNGNIAENFRKWKQQLTIFLIAIGADQKPAARRKAIILNVAGGDVMEIYNHFTYRTLENGEVEDQNGPNVLLQKIEEYCNPRKSEIYESYKFWTTPLSSPVDHFVAELRTKAKNCNFGELTDRLIRDKIIFTITDNSLKTRVMREQEDLKLKKLVDICRAHEMAQGQMKDMETTNTKINKVKSAKKYEGQYKRVQEPNVKDCHYCGKKHVMKKESCPAWGKTCVSCKKRNHFATKCPSTSKVHAVEQPEEEDKDSGENAKSVSWIGSLSSEGKRLHALMSVNGNNVKFQLDSGAEINTICEKYVDPSQISPTQRKLVVWSGASVDPIGEVELEINNPASNSSHLVNFVVVGNNLSNLLGLTTMKSMNLISVNKDMFRIATLAVDELTMKFASVFDGALGNLPGEVKLHVKPDVMAKQYPSKCIPFAIEAAVKKELDRLEELGVLTPIEDPTEWVNQMSVTRKKNGELRICIDSNELKSALMREHYQLPTLEDTLAKFSDVKVLSKLDVCSAYWHMKLDEESSKLTSMITPFGRYRWLRLPFGLCVSSEIFQRNLIQALEGLKGVTCIADDIVVTGTDDDEHDRNLESLLKRCQQKGIKLNPKKMALGCEEIPFHGHVFTRNGIKPDPEKIKAIVDIPTPKDVHDVRRFCGMIQYLAKFVPDLAETAAPLRALTHKDAPWIWSTEQQTALDTLKKKVTQSPLLAHYEPNAELTLQADASLHGLGAALLQHGVPIAYVSRALTPAETRYAQIEKECLSVVYGLERFDQYTYGRHVTVQNDHKPLEVILQKPLNAAPKRLQAMMMRMNRYDINLQYKPGDTMIIADTLSRVHAPYTGSDSDQNMFEHVNALAFMPITDNRIA